MLTVSRHEVALAFLHSVQNSNRPMAMMTTMGNGGATKQIATGIAVGTTMAEWDTHTAIVNLVQSANARGIATKNREIYTTEFPTEACVGIAKLMTMKAIYLFDAGGVVRLNLTGTQNISWTPMESLVGALGPDDKLSLPDELSTADLRAARSPVERERRAATWYEELDARWAKLKPYQKTGLKDSFEGLSTWTGVSRLQMPGVPIAGGRGIMRAEYAEELFMTLAYTIAARGWGFRRERTGSRGGHHIAAVLASHDGTIHGWGVNSNSVDNTRHAETNLIQSLNRPIPPGATLYTTLQSCFMCAGLFVHAGGKQCVYGQVDPTMNGKTALARWEKPARDRFSGTVVVGPDGPRVVNYESMGQHLEAQRSTFLQRAHNESMRLVPNYLKTVGAGRIYSYAEERLINLGRAAKGPAEETAWRNIMTLLQVQGLSLPPNLTLGDEREPTYTNGLKPTPQITRRHSL